MEKNLNSFFDNISDIEEKRKIAKKISEKVKDGDVIGFGSGSTSYLAILEISNKIKNDNLNIVAIPTSKEIQLICAELNIPTANLMEKKPDWSFDGVDEVTGNNWMIKGRGAAMFKEKLNIKNSKQVYILADSSKFVNKLCEKHPIPVECFPDAVNYVKEEILKLGAQEIKLRLAEKKDGPVITENGNFILDIKFSDIDENLEKNLKSIVGVIETGLFINYTNVEVMK